MRNKNHSPSTDSIFAVSFVHTTVFGTSQTHMTLSDISGILYPEKIFR